MYFPLLFFRVSNLSSLSGTTERPVNNSQSNNNSPRPQTLHISRSEAALASMTENSKKIFESPKGNDARKSKKGKCRHLSTALNK